MATPTTPKGRRAGARQEAGTPGNLFTALHGEYEFTIDACAVAHNAKLPAYLSPEDNALALDWSGERVWCNPPYDDIPAWLEHAQEPDFAAFLLPARTDRLWWMRWSPLAEVHWFVGETPHRRIQFHPPPGVKYSSNPDCNVLLLFGNDTDPRRTVWRSGRDGKILKVVNYG